MDITRLFLTFSLIGGQWILYLLIGLSLLSIAIIIERALYFRANGPDPWKASGEGSRILLYLKEGKKEEAARCVAAARGPEDRCIREALSFWEEGIERVEQKLQEQVATEQVQMEKRLLFLGTLGNNAPFIGLLGTVLGIIKAFYDLSVTGAGGPSVVMLGIAEALIATALGLFVAIPAVIAYNFFQRQVRLIRQRLDQFATTALIYLTATPIEKIK